MRYAALSLALCTVTCDTPNMTNATNPSDPNNPNNPNDPVGSLSSDLKNGTRLHNKYINAEDGTVALGSIYALYDTQRNEDCSFAPAEDGQLRCLPAAGAYVIQGYFVDSGCSKAIVIGSQTCAPADKYARIQVGATCGSGAASQIATVSEISAPASIYYKSGASCLSTSNPYAGTYHHYQLGPVIPASSFVAGMPMN